MNATNEEAARNAGRGGIFVLGAKVFFIVIGFVQQSLLKHALGLSEYGALARILAPSNIVNNVVVQGSIQGVSRRVAPARGAWKRELLQSMRVHVPLAVVIAVAFVLLADPIASFQKAPHITTGLRTMGVVALAYGIYAPLVGALNGRTRFGKQAALDVTFATLRTLGLVGVGYWFVKTGGSGAVGAAVGFAIAAALIVLPAAFWARKADAISADDEKSTPTVAPRTYLVGLASVALAQVLVNALMQADITLVGRYLSLGAESAGLVGDEARKRADEWVGVYRACQLFAFLPYQLVLSVAQVLFPMVAKAHGEGDDERVRAIVTRGMRIGVLLAGLLVAIVASLSATMLRFAYDAEVAQRGASALRVLAIGQGAFAIFGIATTVLVSLGRERTSALLSAAALAFVGIGCVTFASSAPFGAPQIERTAAATSAGLFIALGLATLAVRKNTGTFAPASTFVRASITVGVLALCGTFVPALPRLLAPVAAAGVSLVYVLLLALSGELKRADLDALRRVVSSRRR